MLEDRDIERLQGMMQGMIDASQEKLAGMLGREFLNIHAKFDGIDRKFGEVDKRFDAMDQRFDAMDKRFDAMDKRFDGVDQRLDSVEKEIKTTREELSVRLARLEEQVKQIRTRIESLEARLVDHRAEHEIFELELAGIKKMVRGVEEKKGKLDWAASQEILEAVQRRIGRLEEAVFA
ncbi:MAG: hypothetical protein B1H02_04710 [Candidatus Latescibacteria bacterium 4484_107]|nr:MAG: hypothetical protein B1H02_04710 [Candidatus Latescibacteria bacterium 4484_107]